MMARLLVSPWFWISAGAFVVGSAIAHHPATWIDLVSALVMGVNIGWSTESRWGDAAVGRARGE